jgi:hypothetical protein
LWSRFDCMRRRHASPIGVPRWHPSGTVRATPALMRFSRSSDPIWSASRSKPPSELKKIGRSRFGRAAKKSRNRCAALSSNWPSPAIHSLQPRPQAFGSPVARIKIIGSFLTFASRRSISLGSSLAAMEIAGMQQSAATTNRVNSRVTMMVSYERIFRITLIEFESNCCADRLPMPSSAAVALGRSDRHCERSPPQFAKNAPTATQPLLDLRQCAENQLDPCTAARARAVPRRSPD